MPDYSILDHTLLAIDFTPGSGSGARPAAGRIVLDLDPLPDRIGSLIIPDSARALDNPVRDISHTGVVVAVGYGPFGGELSENKKKWRRFPGLTPDDVKPGDRVAFRLVMSDLGKKRVIGDVRRVDAVIEP